MGLRPKGKDMKSLLKLLMIGFVCLMMLQAGCRKSNLPDMEQLIKKEPFCGRPLLLHLKMLNQKEDMAACKASLKTAQDRKLSRSQVNGWIDALKMASGEDIEKIPDAQFEFTIHPYSDVEKPKDLYVYILEKMGIIFDVPKNDALYQKRLQSITPNDTKEWKATFVSVLGTEVDSVPMLMTLVTVNSIFEVDRYNNIAAEELQSRVAKLNATDIKLWSESIPSFFHCRIDAALAIAHVNGFFPDKQFDRKVFTSVFKK